METWRDVDLDDRALLLLAVEILVKEFDQGRS